MRYAYVHRAKLSQKRKLGVSRQREYELIISHTFCGLNIMAELQLKTCASTDWIQKWLVIKFQRILIRKKFHLREVPEWPKIVLLKYYTGSWSGSGQNDQQVDIVFAGNFHYARLHLDHLPKSLRNCSTKDSSYYLWTWTQFQKRQTSCLYRSRARISNAVYHCNHHTRTFLQKDVKLTLTAQLRMSPKWH